jgi:hypothetical protein
MDSTGKTVDGAVASLPLGIRKKTPVSPSPEFLILSGVLPCLNSGGSLVSSVVHGM